MESNLELHNTEIIHTALSRNIKKTTKNIQSELEIET